MQNSVAFQSDDERKFGNTLFSDLFLPLDRAKRPPSLIYDSPAWFELERRRLFLKAWHFACLASDLPTTGDYRTRTFVGTSIIVARGDDHELRAFYNTCRHRGAPLSDKSFGNVRNFVCPFHRWAYRLDGRLFRAPGVESADSDYLCRMDSNLIELPCEVRDNLVFVHLDTHPELEIDAFLGDYLHEVARPHRTDRMRCVHNSTYTLKSNWKLYAEVDMETLHTPHIHRTSIGEQPVEIAEPNGHWVGVFNRSDHTPALSRDNRGKGFSFTAGTYGKGRQGAHFCIVLPGFFIVTAQDCMWWIQKTPITATSVEVNVGYCFPEETMQRDDYDLISSRYERRWNQVIEEDDLITVYQQKGLNEHVTGRYTPRERVVHEFDKKIIEFALRGGYA